MGTSKLSRNHNATSYSTETAVNALVADFLSRRDHNATSYSTETDVSFWYVLKDLPAEIITLRAIALKPFGSPPQQVVSLCRDHNATSYSTETTPAQRRSPSVRSRDHNATSYSTETLHRKPWYGRALCRDHNATSYSTETECSVNHFAGMCL